MIEIDGCIALSERNFRARQERLLFAYLVANRGRTISREELRGLLWPDAEAFASSTLNSIVSRVKRTLSTESLSTVGVKIESSSAGLDLLLPPGTWLDFEAARHHLDLAEGALRNGKPRDAFGPSAVAVGITARRFLPDCKEPWAEAQRTRAMRYHMRALECLSQVWLASDEANLAVDAASEALEQDPWREASLRLLMTALSAAGDTGAAVEVYHSYRKKISEALGISPEAETEQVFLALLS